MILLSIYIVLIILNFKFPRSKVLFAIDFLFMWILMGWNHSTADYSVYLTRYTHPEIYKTLEPLYVLLQNLGQSLGMDYNLFLIAMSFLFLFIRMLAIRKLSNKPNIVIALYLMFPFIMDITQVRMFYATSLILLGLVFLLKNTKKDNLIFMAFVLMATSIHAACIFYGLLLLVNQIDKKSPKKYAHQLAAIVVIAYLMLFSGALYYVVSIASSFLGFGTKFVETAFATSMAYKITHKITYMIEIGLFWAFFNYIFGRAIRKRKKDDYIKENIPNNNLLISCYKFNYTMLLLLPLAWFSGDIYRVQHGLLGLFYALYSNSYYMRNNTRGRCTLYQLATVLFMILFIFLFLVGLESLRETVFMPVFFENVFIG